MGIFSIFSHTKKYQKTLIIIMNKLALTVMLAMGLTAVCAEGNLRAADEKTTTTTTTTAPTDGSDSGSKSDDSTATTTTTSTSAPSSESAGSALSASVAISA